jgi:glycosyltransferase involved in cell wall biosynthesis
MGKGPLENALKKLAHDLGIAASVIFTGNVPDGKKYFKAFDVFALTSDHEPFGMVLLEAMAADVPLICSDCGGGAEVVRDVGQLFPLGDAEALAKCLVSECKGSSEITTAKMHTKLNELFSDEAARKHFWSLPFVSRLSNGQ